MLRSVFVLQAAELLGVSRRTIYYRIRAGSLKTVRTRCGSQRVLLESIEAQLRRRLGRVVANSGAPDSSDRERVAAPGESAVAGS